MRSGEPIFKFKGPEPSWPCQAGTWNHRAEAVYRAAQEFASHENVAPVLKRGLVHVKFVHWRIPSKVWQRFIVTHNSFHQGSGQNFQEYLEDALNCESEWERHVSKTGMHSSNPKYRQTYRDFVVEQSSLDAFGIHAYACPTYVPQVESGRAKLQAFQALTDCLASVLWNVFVFVAGHCSNYLF